MKIQETKGWEHQKGRVMHMVNLDDLSFLEPEYSEFTKQKEIYIKEKTNQNYVCLTLIYAGVDATLKDLLNRGILSSDEFYHIREKLKEGL